MLIFEIMIVIAIVKCLGINNKIKVAKIKNEDEKIIQMLAEQHKNWKTILLVFLLLDFLVFLAIIL